jgi:hypothetical protein
MLVEFYGVEPGFPLTTHLITRSMETAFPKRLYFVSVPHPFPNTAQRQACSRFCAAWLVHAYVPQHSRACVQ